MYLGAQTLGELTNPQRAILTNNAYQAARIALGTSGAAGTPDNAVVSRVAEEYTAPLKATLSVTPGVDDILKDSKFQGIVAKYSSRIGGGGGVASKWGLTGQLIHGVPNLLVYGTGAILATLGVALLTTRKKKGRKR